MSKMGDVYIEIGEYLVLKSPAFYEAWECGCSDCEVTTNKKIDAEFKTPTAGPNRLWALKR